MDNQQHYFYYRIMIIIFLSLLSTQSFCQVSGIDSTKNPLENFVGDWVLKDGIWKGVANGKHWESVHPDLIFNAKLIGPQNTLLWLYDFGKDGPFTTAVVLWAYDEKSNIVYDLSNNSNNHVAMGKGRFEENNDLKIKMDFVTKSLIDFNLYHWHWISPDEFELIVTIYKNNTPTGNTYGGTFVRNE